MDERFGQHPFILNAASPACGSTYRPYLAIIAGLAGLAPIRSLETVLEVAMRLFSRDSFARHFISGFAIGAAGLLAVQVADARNEQPKTQSPSAVTQAAR